MKRPPGSGRFSQNKIEWKKSQDHSSTQKGTGKVAVDMDNIKIYLKTDNHSIKRAKRTGIYLMSFTKKDSTLVTYPPIERIMESIIHTETTWIETEAELLTRAFSAVSRPCEVQIYTECPQLEIMLDLWLPTWREKEWKKSGGEDVPEVYRELAEQKEPHQITITREGHEFSSWMDTQIAKSKGE